MNNYFYLKVHKCEISDRSDFPDFYTIKSLCDFRGSFRGAKFLTRMRSLFLKRFFYVWATQTICCGAFKTIS